MTSRDYKILYIYITRGKGKYSLVGEGWGDIILIVTKKFYYFHHIL